MFVDKYHFKEKEALLLEKFMKPMLETNPEFRSSARKAILNSEWLSSETDFDFKFT